MVKQIGKCVASTAVVAVAVFGIWLMCSARPGPEPAAAQEASDPSTPPAAAGLGYAVSPVSPNEFKVPAKAKRAATELKLVCRSVDEAPEIDALSNDSVWSLAETVATLDFSSQRTITIAAVHTSEKIFFLVTYPDSAPSVTHKSFAWDEKADIYKPYNDREDMFVFKWSTEGPDVDLRLRGGQPHHADIWFWKACRTNPAGYADDKFHIYSTKKQNEGDTEIFPRPGRSAMYLIRRGDSGRSAYRENIPVDYAGPFAPRFSNRTPLGSRRDVQACGKWSDGLWTIQFERKLDTGDEGDVLLAVGGEYLFIVSCYEMSGDTVHPEWSQPLYRTGDGFDRILLQIVR